jgi:hypothetical protein
VLNALLGLCFLRVAMRSLGGPAAVTAPTADSA